MTPKEATLLLKNKSRQSGTTDMEVEALAIGIQAIERQEEIRKHVEEHVEETV